MTTPLRSKTLTQTLARDPRSTFDWIANPDNLGRWYAPVSRLAPVRFIRDDRAFLVDLTVPVDGVELSIAIRLLPNGEGSEVVLTLIQPRGISDAIFQQHARWAGSALAELKKGQPAADPGAEESVIASPMPEEQAVPVAGESEMPEPPVIPASGRKLFVGNLPFAWTEEPLRELFAAQGTVLNAAIARLRGRGNRSRGFGFVEMSTEAEAQTSIEKLHDGLAGDRKMIVRLARSQESRPDSDAPAPRDAAAPARRNTSRPESARKSGRPRQGNPPSRRPSGRPSPAPRSERPVRRTGISNNSGYEIYPRDASGGFATEPTTRSSAPPRSAIEPSPYFDDNEDDNRGNRSPRRRGQ